ncbi:hypothetical protein ABKN59_002053 [Abortiporus biennis]
MWREGSMQISFTRQSLKEAKFICRSCPVGVLPVIVPRCTELLLQLQAFASFSFLYPLVHKERHNFSISSTPTTIESSLQH